MGRTLIFSLVIWLNRFLSGLDLTSGICFPADSLELCIVGTDFFWFVASVKKADSMERSTQRSPCSLVLSNLGWLPSIFISGIRARASWIYWLPQNEKTFETNQHPGHGDVRLHVAAVEIRGAAPSRLQAQLRETNTTRQTSAQDIVGFIAHRTTINPRAPRICLSVCVCPSVCRSVSLYVSLTLSLSLTHTRTHTNSYTRTCRSVGHLGWKLFKNTAARQTQHSWFRSGSCQLSRTRQWLGYPSTLLAFCWMSSLITELSEHKLTTYFHSQIGHETPKDDHLPMPKTSIFQWISPLWPTTLSQHSHHTDCWNSSGNNFFCFFQMPEPEQGVHCSQHGVCEITSVCKYDMVVDFLWNAFWALKAHSSSVYLTTIICLSWHTYTRPGDLYLHLQVSIACSLMLWCKSLCWHVVPIVWSFQPSWKLLYPTIHCQNLLNYTSWIGPGGKWNK